MPVVVGEAQLGAGMGILAAAQHPGAVRPVAQVHPAGQLADLGAGADLPLRLDRRRPCWLRLGKDRLADMGVDLHAQGEPDAALAQVPGQPGAGPGAVGADQHRPLVSRELGQGEVDHSIRS